MKISFGQNKKYPQVHKSRGANSLTTPSANLVLQAKVQVVQVSVDLTFTPDQPVQGCQTNDYKKLARQMPRTTLSAPTTKVTPFASLFIFMTSINMVFIAMYCDVPPHPNRSSP